MVILKRLGLYRMINVRISMPMINIQANAKSAAEQPSLVMILSDTASWQATGSIAPTMKGGEIDV